MGKFRAKIVKISEDASQEIPFEFDTIQDLSTRTMATNNHTQPVFDVFANQGTLVLKDKDLTLYNNAINGVFDNAYQFEVFLYKGETLLARHIINQRPYYDFANKTLTLSLGNSIDSFANSLYKGFEYPLNPQKIQIIQESILKNVFGSTSEGKDNFSFEGYSGTYDWNDIEASVAYLPELSSKEAMKKTLEAIGCSMIETPTINNTPNKLKLIDMLGRETNAKVYKLLPKHTRKSFKPNIILDNRFSNVCVNATNLYSQVENKPVFIVSEKVDENKIVDINTLVSFFKNDPQTKLINGDVAVVLNFGELLVTQRKYYKIQQEQSVYQNLETLLEIDTDNPSKNENPTITIICQKQRFKNIENIGKKEVKYVTSDKKITVDDWGLSNISTNLNDNTKWEKTYDEIKEFGRIYYPSFTGGGVLVEGDVGNYYGENIFKIEDNILKIDTKILVGLEYYELFTEDNIALANPAGTSYSQFIPTIQKVIYTPLSVNITYNGIVKEIKLDEVLQLNSTENNINKFETEKGNELIQTNLDGTIPNSTASKLQEDLYNFYKDGIRTGDIDVIFSDYVSTDESETKDIDTPFKVGDYVVPCKDNQGTPIITLTPLTDEKEYTITEITSYDRYVEGEFVEDYKGLYYWEKTINARFIIKEVSILEAPKYGYVEIKINNNKVTIYLFSTDAGTKESVKIKVKFDEQNITPIYKVVDVEIDLDGGAGVQRLKLMENPNIILSEETAQVSQINEEEDILSNNEESGVTMSFEGSDDLIGL